MDIEERINAFKKETLEVGGLIYTKAMLNNFISYWTERDRGKKPKTRAEREKTFEISRRLATWARNNFDNIQFKHGMVKC